jgi:Na+-transporting NADH:ubiquinone oxidoreductase subunit B
MKSLRKQFDKLKPNFEKGGKFHPLGSLFDAIETLFFVPNKTSKSSVHIRDSKDSKRLMIIVVLAMVPALLFGMWNTGNQHFLSINETVDFWTAFWYGFLKVLPIIIVSYAVGLGIELVIAQMRGHEVKEGFFVSGMLIPLILPVSTPLWMVAVATAFAVIIGVEAFGGAGMNILNPALTARAFLFFAYPSHMSGDAVWIAEKADAYSGATPLAEAAAGHTSNLPSALDMFYGFIPGSIGETSTLAILIGAFILIYTGVGSWKIMLSTAIGGLAMGLIFKAFSANAFMAIPAYYHLLMGGFAFGAVFMATDPVSAAQTNRGKYIYGFLIGFIAVLIRVLNPAYPEGMMLAILLMNVFAPLIDHYVVQGNIKRRLKRLKVKA